MPSVWCLRMKPSVTVMEDKKINKNTDYLRRINDFWCKSTAKSTEWVHKCLFAVLCSIFQYNSTILHNLATWKSPCLINCALIPVIFHFKGQFPQQHQKLLPLNASRLNAVSKNLFSSARWVNLFPVAGAAAGSRPTYLKVSVNIFYLVRISLFRLHQKFSLKRDSPYWILMVHREETWPYIVIVAHVLVLLLTPYEFSVAVLLNLCLDEVKREWWYLRGKNIFDCE